MARPLRIEYEGAYYHVMNRGLERRKIFLADEDRERFLALIKDAWKRWGIEVYAYCLMDNHYHLFLQTPRGNISRVMRHIDGLYTQSFNRIYKRDGPLLRGRYKAVLVDADSYLLELVRYIHLNPVKADMVDDPGKYPWSSHSLYRLPDYQKPAWLAWSTIMSFFLAEGGRAQALEAFEKFVASGEDKSLVAFYEKKRRGVILGSENFVNQVLEKLKPTKHHIRSEKNPQFPDLEAVCLRVGKNFKMEKNLILNGRKGKENLPRNLAIYISSRIAGFSHNQIKPFFALKSDSAVTKTCQRLEERLNQDNDLKNKLGLITGSSNMSHVKT